MRCAAAPCPWQASALATRVPPIDAARRGFVIVRPLGAHGVGVPLCVDHAHAALDATLLAALDLDAAP